MNVAIVAKADFLSALALTITGHRVEAETVIDKPASGFSGLDQFAYTSTKSNGTVLTHQGAVELR